MTNRFLKLELEPARQAQDQAAQTQSHLAAAQHAQDELHDSGYWMVMADKSRRAGAFEDALRFYSRALELDRAMVRGWVGQVQMLIALEEYNEAELWARKALELFRNHVELTAARAQALCRNGDLKNAQAACDAAMAQPGQSAYPWMVRGDLLLARRDPVEDHCFSRAVQLDGDWLVLLEIAAIYLFYRKHAKALTRLRQATEQAPDQAYCWLQQGQCEAAMGLDKPARRSFKQCLDLNPKSSAARIAMIAIESRRGFFGRLFGRFRGEG